MPKKKWKRHLIELCWNMFHTSETSYFHYLLSERTVSILSFHLSVSSLYNSSLYWFRYQQFTSHIFLVNVPNKERVMHLLPNRLLQRNLYASIASALSAIRPLVYASEHILCMFSYSVWPVRNKLSQFFIFRYF